MNDLDVAAVVAAERHGLQHDVARRIHRRHLQSVAAEQQRVRRKLERRSRAGRQLEVHFRVRAGQQLVLRVVHDQLREQRARRIQRVRMRSSFAL